jgi:acetyl-CoA carboxylase biotin carboxyl carrier protein
VEIKAEMAGTVVAVLCAEGDEVATDAELLVMESMKMEIPVATPKGGVVSSLRVAEGDVVQQGDVLVVVA